MHMQTKQNVKFVNNLRLTKRFLFVSPTLFHSLIFRNDTWLRNFFVITCFEINLRKQNITSDMQSSYRHIFLLLFIFYIKVIRVFMHMRVMKIFD